jgi:hypothetical protein
MKKTILILAFLLSFSEMLIAQNDSIFPNLRGEWEQKYWFNIIEPSPFFGKFILKKIDENYDTMGLYSFKLEQNFEELLIAKLYSDSLKVYVKKATNEEYIDNFQSILNINFSDEYMILYDFSLEIGDTAYFSSLENDFIRVYNIDTLIINDEKRKKYYLTPGIDTWIQGLGSIRHPLYPIIYNSCFECYPIICNATLEFDGPSLIDTFNYIEPFNYCEFINMKENDLNSFKLYPNPLYLDKLKIEIEEEIETIKIYDSKLNVLVHSLNICKKNEEIDLSNYSSGLFFIEIKTKEKILRQSIIKL